MHYTCYVNQFGQSKLIQIYPELRPTPESLEDCGWVLKRFPTRVSLGHLTCWMQLGRVAEMYEGLRDLSLKEQLLKTRCKNLAMLIPNQYLQVYGRKMFGVRM